MQTYRTRASKGRSNNTNFTRQGTSSRGVTWGVGPVFMAPTGGCDRGSEKWSLGASAPIITANWEAASGQEWTIPFGIGIGKVTSLGKLPTNVSGQYYYNVVTPDYGAERTLGLQIQFLVPR